MAYTLIIGNKNYSSWSLRPWFWMKQAGIEFTEKRLALFTDDYRQQIVPYFSNYKVPVLRHDALNVWDTIAIMEYLAELHPEAPGWPIDAAARATARSASAEMHSGFSALRAALPMNCRKHFPGYPITNSVQRDIDRITALWEHCKQNHGTDGDWLFGRFSIADAMYAPVVLRLAGYDVSLAGFAADYVRLVLGNEHIKNWIDAGKQETEIIPEDEV
ncbi:MAG: glutathione S-transferase family protein [Gammaproteobacteria bacterium]|nr:glutathione S-transferase family protein [Gammaproteobacteria bacterium]